MNDKHTLAPWIKRFLLEYLPSDRNFARNTQHSYRDALRLLVTFAGTTLRKRPDELLVEDISADLVKRFLRHIEEVRKCSISTRNQRLAAVHTLASSSVSTARNICPGAPTYTLCPSKGTGTSLSGILKGMESMHSLLPQTKPHDSERGTTLCCCLCTTRVLGLAKWPS